MKNLFEKIKDWNSKWILIVGICSSILFPTAKWLINGITTTIHIVSTYPTMENRMDSLHLRIDLLEDRLDDYEIVKKGVTHLMQDNEILSGLLRANMIKINDKNYGTVLIIYDPFTDKNVRRLVEVKLRKSFGSGDLYVFVSSVYWDKDYIGVSVTKKFAVKWHEDEKKYYFIDKKGDFHLIYEVDIENTIHK
jgi:hypothetical protein